MSKVFFISKQLHIRSRCEKRCYGDVSLMDCYGVALDIVRADVIDLVADLDVHITLTLLELVGEVGGALVGEENSLDLVGNIYVEDRILVEKAVVGDKLVYVTEMLGRFLLSVGEGRERDAAVSKSARLKDSCAGAGVDEVYTHVYTAVDT